MRYEFKWWHALIPLPVVSLIFRKQIARGASMVASAVQDEAFKLAVSALGASPYYDVILRVAREQGLDPFLLAGFGYVESRWGAALSPKGPGGTGDGGHGRGLLQIDDRTWGDWLSANNWGDPYTNVTKGAQIFKQGYDFFQANGAGKKVVLNQAQAAKRGVAPGSYPDPRPLSGLALLKASVAAYNTGTGNVLKSIAAGLDPDLTTTNSAGYPGTAQNPGHYAEKVLAGMSTANSAYQHA